MYKIKDSEPELTFMEIKSGLKLSLISIFSIQLVFQILVLLFIQIISYLQSTLSLNILSPRGLSSFALDMWLMVLVLSLSLVGYSFLYKTKDFPLYSLTVYPALLIFVSMIRDVSLLQVIVFSLISCAAVLQIIYHKIKQLEFLRV